MRLPISSQVYIRLGYSPETLAVHSVRIQPGWNLNQTYNTQVNPRRPKAFCFGRARILRPRCNVIITGLADHGLHVIFFATAMSSFSYRLIITTTSSLSYRLGYKSVLAFSGAEVLRVACEPNKQFALIAGSQKLLTNQRLFEPGGGGVREVPSRSTKENHQRRSHE